ncbi:TRAP transporter substrate-binding protein [Photobacterium satsumensis]|uniref:TRAP transporter substrate-binding protein n=1 Tax=Photobacterium satsumensis TaxID=2910239 RepID=UPI003D0DDBA1
MKYSISALLTAAVMSFTSLNVAASDITMTYATPTHNNTHWAKTINLFSDYASEYTDEKFDVSVSWGGAMGNDVQLIQKTQLGSQVQAAVTSGAVISSTVPAFRVLDIPFLVEDADSLRALFYPEGRLEGPVVDALQKNMHKKNLHLLSVFPTEFRGIMSSNAAIRSPKDVNGLKIRVTPSAVEREIMRSLGAGPTTMAVSEVFTAMQTGTVDGLAIPPITSTAFALGEVAGNFTMLDFQNHGSYTVVNKRFWESLPDEVRENVQRATDQSIIDTLDIYETEFKTAIETLTSQGVDIYYPTREEKDEFKDIILEKATKVALERLDADEIAFYEAIQAVLN